MKIFSTLNEHVASWMLEHLKASDFEPFTHTYLSYVKLQTTAREVVEILVTKTLTFRFVN
jgi:hypothetical protein